MDPFTGLPRRNDSPAVHPRRVDLNCDLGEGYGAWRLGDDEGLAKLVSSVNIACGAHAGDPGTMSAAVRLAARCGAAVGAHVSYPDRQGFGRRAMGLTPEEVEGIVLYQLGALDAFCRAEGHPLSHVKPHGAFYWAAFRDPATAGAVVSAVAKFDRGLGIYAPSGSALLGAARGSGLTTVAEVFCDRGYRADGTLVDRSHPGALVTDPLKAGERALKLALTGETTTVEGTSLRLEAETICLHGDTQGAVALAGAVRRALEGAGVRIIPPFAQGAA